MAVHPAMPGLSVTIGIDGTAAPEFGSASALSGIYRFYTNCRSGAKYSIDVFVGSGFVCADASDLLRFDVCIDGRKVGWFYVSKPTHGPSNQFLRFDHRCMTEADGSSSPQYFVFSELASVEVADDDTIKADKKRIRSMGSIDSRISRPQARGRAAKH
ncbi:hypothetical protein FOMG_19992 [Fusarium oxysporum f. sp. melonis 26406]|uniref:DUF7918 domain-containing protein n=1 Tax=Fusarium oxysporum f. sp. melonis 26406 TaxID=1089452 RepID=W9Z4N8_FUSOX|nr:hypothetical protein FOMG_19992 [Fusarium oxysporum f. sp. melonis 26406]